MTDTEIRLFSQNARRLTNLFWRAPGGLAHQVVRVEAKWMEDAGHPKQARPVVVLANGSVASLQNAELSQFFVAQPLLLGESQVPTRFVERVMDSLALLCHGERPPRGMVEAWFRDESEELQDWALNHAAPYWATGIGTLEAAVMMADTPEEGISDGNGPEHEDRKEAFPD